MGVITHTTSLPDSSEKTDFYSLVDNAQVSAIVNNDIASNAAIAGSKLATITTAGKVDGSAINNLANIPTGAGNIPSANMSANAIVKTGTQTATGVKTFTDGIVSNVTGNVTGNITGNVTGNTAGTHTGSVALGGGTVTGGTLGVSDQLSHNMGNGETFMVPAGYYINGVTRGADGSIDTIYYCKL